MPNRIVVEYYTAPGLTPQTAMDTFNGHDGIDLDIRTTTAGVLEIRVAAGNGKVIKAYAPGRWIDAKVLE